MRRLGLGLLGLGGTRSTAAGNPYASDALALNFVTGEYWDGTTLRSGQAGLAAMPGYSYTRSGAKSELNSAGSLVAFAANVPGITDQGYWSWAAAENILLNAGSATGLVTQSVTVAASAYTLSFIGTGTITLSGASTAGPLVGTGASNRVSLTFTPTAGTLALTVTGTVQYAGLVLGTQPGPIIVTTGSTATVGADDLDLTSGITDVDHILACVVNFKTSGGTPYLIGHRVSGNTFMSVRRTGGTINLNVFVANVDQSNQNASTGVTTGRCAVIICRRGGKWLIASRYGGTTTISSESAAASFPGPSPILNVGHSEYGPLNGLTELVRHRVGTFDNAAITAQLLGMLP